MLSLAPLHTFGLPSSAQTVHEIATVDALQQLLINRYSGPYLILGEGSNTVFLEDYAGEIYKISLKGIQVEELDEHFAVTVQAGENWHQLVEWTLQHAIFGLENLALIPGTVGAAPIQNIGAYGVELAKFVEQVSYLDTVTGEIKTLSGEQCNFGYRESIFKHDLLNRAVITQVTFHLPKAWQPATQYGELSGLVAPSPLDIFNKVVEVRRTKLPDPNELGNAGSFFKNPVISKHSYAGLKLKFANIPCYVVDEENVKVPAAWLIDTLGFKGKKVGGIACHSSQPLVLTNDGTGTGADLLKLAREIRSQVQQVFAIHLENEVRLIDRNGPISL